MSRPASTAEWNADRTAQWLGVPQQRQRTIFVGVRNVRKKSLPKSFHYLESKGRLTRKNSATPLKFSALEILPDG